MPGYQFSAESNAVIGAAKGLAAARESDRLGPLHLWEALLLGCPDILDAVREALLEVPSGPLPAPIEAQRRLDTELAAALKRARVLAEQYPLSEAYEITPRHLEVGLLGAPQVAALLREPSALAARREEQLQQDAVSGPTTVGHELLADFEPLKAFGRLLTTPDVLRDLPQVFGREEELSQLTSALVKFGRANVIITGPAGVGKTTFVYGLAQLLVSSSVPAPLQGCHLFELNTNALTAGTMYRGQFEERLQQLLDVLVRHREVILFVDEFHAIVGLGTATGQPQGAENVLKNYLASGRIRCIGTTTFEEYREFIEADAAFERRFTQIRLREPDREGTMRVLQGLREPLEKHYHLSIDDELLALAYDLSERYLKSRNQPDKAVDLLAEAGARRCIIGGGEQLLAEDLQHAASQLGGGVPVRETEQDRNLLRRLEQSLNERVLGQSEAMAQVARGVIGARGLTRDPNKPRGVFLFAGPTGVGKTLTAELLAQILFGSADSLVYLDCADLADGQTAVSELRGVSRWYVHSEQGGRLTSPVWERPYSVVLLDEIEKAHPSVWNALLPVLDEGRLEDARGRVVDFTETFLILTTNSCSELLSSRPQQRIGFRSLPEMERQDPAALEALRSALVADGFPREFIGRIHRIVVFTPFDRAQRLRIVNQRLEKLAARLSETEGKRLVWDDAVAAALEAAADAGLGARGLINIVRDRVGAELSQRSVNDPQWPAVDEVRLGVGDEQAVAFQSKVLRGQVLVADDKPRHYERLAAALPEYDWCYADSEETVLAKVEELGDEGVAVILLAVHFGASEPPEGAEGPRILKALRDRGVTTPVVMMTGTSNVAAMAECFKLGAYDYVPKPIELDLVRNVLQRVSGVQRLELQNAAQAAKIEALQGRVTHEYDEGLLQIRL